MPMARRHSFSSLFRPSSLLEGLDSDDSQHSLDDMAIAELSSSRLDTATEASTNPPLRRSSGGGISRSNSLSNLSSKAAAVASLGLIAGAEAFSGTGAAAAASSGRMARRGSMESASSNPNAGSGSTLSRTASARSLASASASSGGASVASASHNSLTSLNMVDPSTLMDAGSHVSGILDNSGLSIDDLSSALQHGVHSSSTLLSKISNTEAIASALAGAANRVFDDNKKAQAEVFGDLSLASGLAHFTHMGKNKNVMEITGIASRVCGLISDYLPDGVISPEEAVFQSCMMAVSAASLSKSLQPVLASSLSDARAQGPGVAFHEKKAYSLFRKVGNLPWLQYRKILAEAGSWIDLDRYESVEDKVDDHDDANYLYLVARGDAFDLDVDSSSLGLLGTLNLADKIKHHHRGARTTNGGGKATIPPDESRPPAQACAPRAGASGAKLLRIDTTKLLDLMDKDEVLADSVKAVVFADMQEKLMGLVQSKSADHHPHVRDENPQLPGEVMFVI
jgi:hypothetical protein